MTDYIQIGVTALRGPSGEFLPSVPMYVRAGDAPQIAQPDGGERGILEALAERFGAYVDQEKGENA